VGGKKGGPGGRREKPQNRRKWKGGSPLRLLEISVLDDPRGPSSVTSGRALRLECSTTKETEQDE